ncbi:hypothetical protein HY932_03075 [Candidatus Falkowbacteria bacterium]|nr:hypothetical protein [Candidatus Falkowbacteria bacterium]
MRKKVFILVVSCLLVLVVSGIVCRVYFYKPGGEIGQIDKCLKLGVVDDIKAACEKEKLIIDSPKVFGNYISAANVWTDIGRKTKQNIFYFRAIEIYKLAIERFEAKYLTNWNIASIYRAMEDYKNVEKYLIAALKANNTEAEPVIALARLYFYNLQKPFEFVDNFYKQYLPKPLIDSAKLLNDYAMFLEENGKTKEALVIYKKLAEKYPEQYEQIVKELETNILK